jgi:hypothetical protein
MEAVGRRYGMFAHQVIEEFSEILSLDWPKSEIGRVKIYEHLVLNIGKAQKFHLGDITDILNATKNITNIDVKEIKFPYDNIYIDFITPGHTKLSKLAILVKQTEQGHQIFTMQCEKSCKDGWVAASSYNEWDKTTLSGVTQTLKNLKLEDKERQLDYQGVMATIAYKTIMLLTCKNIQTETIPAPEALNKKRRKAGKQELFDYHVLNVVVPSKKRGYHETTEPLSHNRVHLCRGHFKEYTAEHPLFGHYTGLYWWQPHVRGQNKDGMVMKDYNVTTK